MLAIIVYRDHATDVERPKWLMPKGIRYVPDKWLLRCGLRKRWDDYLAVMLSMADVDPKCVIEEKQVAKKRGPKPKH